MDTLGAIIADVHAGLAPLGDQPGQLDTRNNRDFGDALIRAVFDEVSVGI